MQRGLQGKPILRKIGQFTADMAIFQVQGAMFSNAVPGVSRVCESIYYTVPFWKVAQLELTWPHMQVGGA